MKKSLLLFACICLSACGGGGTNSGAPNIQVPDLSGVANLPPPRVGAEFVATQCIGSQVEFGGTRISNSCDQDVNVRGISGNMFGPIILVPANSNIIFDGALASLTACFVPRVPGGVVSLVEFQCL